LRDIPLDKLTTQVADWTHRKPMFDVALSGVFDVRAATRYRLQ
jgi:hypothetical protein